jgi:hypothetical protein
MGLLRPARSGQLRAVGIRDCNDRKCECGIGPMDEYGWTEHLADELARKLTLVPKK